MGNLYAGCLTMPGFADIDKTAGPRLSPDNVVLTGEIAELRTKHAMLSKELNELTAALALANTQFTEGTDRIRIFNIEMAVYEKEMKETQGHIFALKKRRAMAVTASGVEQEFNRQEKILTTLGAKQRELNKLLIEIESNTKLFDQTLADKTAVVERLSLTISDMQPRRKALVVEVAELEAAAKIFIEAERLSGELGTLTTGITAHTNEINGLKAFVAEAEPEAAALQAQISEFEQSLAALEQANKEIKELTAQKASLIGEVERLEDKESALSLDSGKLQRELDKQTEILKDHKAVNETNRGNVPALEKELLTYNERIAGAKINLTKRGESKRKKDMELDNFEKALATKLRLESELLNIEEGTAALGEIVRSTL
ncbi:MAG: hypothetical protein HQK96_06655 [Nitrospirae bacterium]|nr:hypothetical protein [Nitrospirota bacterium]